HLRARGCAGDEVLLCGSCGSTRPVACGQLPGGNRGVARSVCGPYRSGRGSMTATEIDALEFRGWPADGLVFLGELGRDNSRRFWTENADRYRVALREPT